MYEHKPLQISMQYFAESASGEPTSAEPTAPSTPADPVPAEPEPSAEPDTTAQLKQLTDANAALQKELDTMRKEHLTQEEQKRLELTQKETEIANREATLRDRENRLHAMQALEKANLTGNGLTSAELLPFVLDSTTDGIDNKVKALSALLEKRAKAETDRIYQAAGRQPYQVRNNGESPSAVPAFRAERAKEQARAEEIRKHYTGGNV